MKKVNKVQENPKKKVSIQISIKMQLMQHKACLSVIYVLIKLLSL